MKITNLKVSNFRNLKTIDVDFGNINILTGKNSTGKTNLTQLLTNCLNTNPNIEQYFGENIVTKGQGLNQTTIETSIIDNFVYSSKKDNFLTINDFRISFKHIIKKDILYSKKHSLINYVGKENSYNSVEDFIKKDKINNLKEKKISKVYEKGFSFIEGFEEGVITDKITNVNDGRYFEIFESNTLNAIINYDDGMSFSSCGYNIFNKVIEKNKELGLKAIESIKSNTNNSGFSSFKIAKFISLLSDIQSNKKQFKKFKDDLSYFSDGILQDVHIAITALNGESKGDIYVKTPHGPKDIEFISAGTSLILYFVVLKNWLDLDVKSYASPDIMIFDELDSAIHPSLIGRFSDLLKIISHKVQLFITTHTTNFIDTFERKDIYLLKDIGSFNEKIKVKSNVMSYEKILESLSKNEQEELKEISNSELYINGYIDTFFPIIK